MDITYAQLFATNIIGACVFLLLLLAARHFKNIFKEIAKFWTSDPRAKELSLTQLITAILFTPNLRPQSIVFKNKMEKVGIYLIPLIILVSLTSLGLTDKLEEYFLNNTEIGERTFMDKDGLERATDPFGWKSNK